MTALEQFDAAFNAAYRNGQDDVVAALRPLRDVVAGLERERDAAVALIAKKDEAHAGILLRYFERIASGDAGSWEDEVIAIRSAIALKWP